jgi:gliding motility-associated-like protein
MLHRYILFLLGTLCVFGNTIAQNTVTIDPQAYDSLKQAGQLTPGTDYRVNLPILPQAPVSQPGGGGQWGGGGGVTPLSFTYIPPDNTYSLAMAPNDDGSSNAINLPFDFCFYGTTYNTVYINNNGNISLGGPTSTFSSTGFPTTGFPMLAPFWADVDTRNGGQVLYKITPTALYVNWVNVGYYSMMNDKVNTFMLVITDQFDPVLSLGNNVGFAYGDMSWTTGAASCWGSSGNPCTYNGISYSCGGSGGYCGTPATVGANQGDGVQFVQFGLFDHPGIEFNGNTNPSGVDWLDNQAFQFNICNIPPVLVNSTLNGNNIGNGGIPGPTALCSGNTWFYSYTFDAPEPNQTTTITVDGTACPGYQLVSNTQNGTQATVVFSVTGNPGVNGTFPIVITAMDDYNPPGITTLTIQVPIVDVTPPVITGPTSYCQGSNVTLSAPPGYMSYQWTPNGEVTQTITATAGTYTVTVNTGGCIATSAPYVVTENLNPVPVITGVPVFCAGSSTTLTATPSGMVQYNWSTGELTPSITLSTPVSVTVTVVDTNGCTGTSAALNVVQGNPHVVITGVQPYCQNDSIPLTAVGANFTTFLWNDGGTDSVNYTTGGYVHVLVTDIYGCTAADSLSTTPLILPTADFSASAVCLGVSTPVTDLSTSDLNDIVQLNWNWGDGNTSTGPQTAHAYSSDGIFSANLIVTTAFGCKDTVSKNITVHPLPVANFGSGNTSGCYPLSVSFTDMSTVTSGAVVQWLWNFGNGTSTQQNPTQVFSGVNTFDVNLVAITNFGCTDTIRQDNYIETFGYPTADFTYSPTTIDMNNPLVTFQDNSWDAVQWSWLFGDGNTSSVASPAYSYTAAGTYIVSLTVTNIHGCTDQTQQELIVDNGFAIYIPQAFSPNGDGMNDSFIISGNAVANYELTIYDRWGVLITSGANIGWDGKMGNKPAQQDVYVYKVRVFDTAGNEYNYQGNVSLLR